MMIDKEVFDFEWATLKGRFDCELPDDLGSRYHQFLSARMSTAEFRAAAIYVLNNSRCFPVPTEFIEAISPLL